MLLPCTFRARAHTHRASKTLTLTLLPRRRSDYTLSLHLHAKSGSQQPGLTLISPAAASAAGGGTAARPPLATAVVSAIAAFPSLLLTDVHCHGLPKQVSAAQRQQHFCVLAHSHSTLS